MWDFYYIQCTVLLLSGEKKGQFMVSYTSKCYLHIYIDFMNKVVDGR